MQIRTYNFIKLQECNCTDVPVRTPWIKINRHRVYCARTPGGNIEILRCERRRVFAERHCPTITIQLPARILPIITRYS